MLTRVANNFQLLAKTVRSTHTPRCSLLFFVALLTGFRSRTRGLSISGRRASFLWPPYRTLWTSRGRRGTSVGWYRLTSTHSSISLNLALASHMYILHQINTWKVPAENVRYVEIFRIPLAVIRDYKLYLSEGVPKNWRFRIFTVYGDFIKVGAKRPL